MTWKTLAKGANSGTATQFGWEDLDKYANLFNGNADVDSVLINSLLRIYDQKLKFRSTGTGNPDYTIVNPSGTTARNITIPNLAQNDTLAFLAEPQTFTGVKTFSTAPVISTITNTGTLTLPTSTDTLVGRATTDTLTNKTLTSPIISSIVNTGTLTLPTATTTLVGRATTDALENKTITNSTINAQNNTVSGFQINPRIRRQGGWYGGAVNQGQGFIAGGLPTNTGQGTAVIDATGKYQPWTSGAVAGNNAGQKSSASNNYLIARVLNCRLIAKFKLDTADANTRCFVGLSNISGATFPAGDSQLDGVHGIGLAFRTTDTVWQIAHNDGTAGSTVYTAVTGNPARGTNIHTLEIFATESTPKFTVILDGGTPQDITTRIPGSTNGMSVCTMVETATTATRTINTWWWHVETDL